MARTSEEKGAPQKMKKVLLTMPEDLHRSLKMRAAATDTTIREIIVRALERELKGGKTKQ